jgi:hypothetical protein
MSYYNEINPPSVYEDDCPCANSETGYDSRCQRTDHREEHFAEVDLDRRCRIHDIRCCTICIEEN